MKRITGILLSIMLIVSMMPSMAVFAENPAVTYLMADGTTATITNYQIMPDCSGQATTTTISGGTYIVNKSNILQNRSALKLLDNVTIIVKKGCTLYIEHVDLNGHKLSIYGENNSMTFGEKCTFQANSTFNSAIINGELEVNSGYCFLVGGNNYRYEEYRPVEILGAFEPLSSDARLTVNNGCVSLSGSNPYLQEVDQTGPKITASISGKVGTGGGITINKCVSFHADGGAKLKLGYYDPTPEIETHGKAFSSSDAGKIILNGTYNIRGANYNSTTNAFQDFQTIQQSNFASQMYLYDMIEIKSPSDPGKDDPGTGGGTGGGGGGAGGSEETPGTKTPSVDVSNSVSVSTQNGKAVASVDVSDKVNDLVKNAADSKAKEVTINAKTSTNVDKVDVTIPADAFAQLAKIDSLNDAVISTGVCDFAIDKQALAEIAKQAPAGSNLKIEAVENPISTKSAIVYELKITAGNKKISSFNGGHIMVTVDIPSELKGKSTACLYENKHGAYTSVQISSETGGKVSFVTQHFSKYIVMSKDEATKLLAKQAKPKFKSVKAIKGKKIAVSFKKLSLANIVSAEPTKYIIQRSTNNKFKKAVKNFTVKSNKSSIKYTDSKNLKKGTKYYYRVRATVKLPNGKNVNTKWSAVKSVKCK